MAKTPSTRTGSSSNAGEPGLVIMDASAADGLVSEKRADEAVDPKAERQRARGRASAVYKVVGRTFDGVDVLQPKMRSTHFRPGEARQLFKDLLGNDGIERILRDSRAAADKA